MRIDPDMLLAAFEGQSEPLSATQIADAVDLAAGDVHVAISELLRLNTLVRVRKGDGVLRYALAGADDDADADGAPAPAPPPEPAPSAPAALEEPEREAEVATAKPDNRPNGVNEAILGGLAKATKPMLSGELRHALGDAYTSAQISGGLNYLRSRGRITSAGAGTGMRWSLNASDQAPPTATAKKPKLGPRDYLAAAETDEKTRKALEFAARVTDDAFEVYLAAIANPRVYVPLKQARDQAREALHAFNTRI